MTSLTGTLEAELEISASQEKFYEIFFSTPSQLCSICPDVYLACDLVEGGWGILGSITQFSYVVGGETKVAKLILDSADSTNNSITYRVLEGNLILEFSFFTLKGEVTQKDEATVASFTLNYIKLGLDVEDPQDFLDMGIHVSSKRLMHTLPPKHKLINV